MQYEKLKSLIKKVEEYGRANKREAIFNVLNLSKKSQKYLLISERPSKETDKTKGADEKHSGFEERVIALFNFGSDDKEKLEKIRVDYKKYRNTFFNNVYWTHYSKERGSRAPDKFWADDNLKEEIRLAEPTLIITFGRLSTDFILGKGILKDRVNRINDYNGISVICCLHPSKHWNIKRRPNYKFYETWGLIRSKIKLT